MKKERTILKYQKCVKSNKKTTIKFQDIQDDLIKALKPLAKDLNEEVNLIDGFISAEFLEELNDNPVLGGPTVPMVALIGEKGGRLYFYSLKKLLPDLEI